MYIWPDLITACDIGCLQPLQGVACCLRTHGRISHHRQIHSDRDVPVRVIFASVIIALALPAPIVSLTCHSQCDADSSSGPSHHSVMVVRYGCMACQCCPTYFTTYQWAAVHYARSVACQQSQRGIATVVLPSSTAEIGRAHV